jgi:predicted GNAT family N-acyltransferase
MSLSIRQIQFGTSEYAAELALRERVLREPLGLTFSEADLVPDKTDFHFAAFSNGGGAGSSGDLVGCLILSPREAGEIKMRQVAISPECQGRGVGRKLVEASEAFAREKGFQKMKLNARETAVPFYLSLGYELIGEPFTEVGIPHRLMQKSLLLAVL